MTAPYSIDLRSRALARKAAGQTHGEIAAALQISPSCLSKWTRHQRKTGSLTPAQIGGHKLRTLSGECAEWLRERVASGLVTLRGLTAELAGRGIKTAPRAVWVFLHAEGLSFKRMARPVCKGDLGWLKRSASTYPVSGTSPGQDGYPRVPGPHKNFGVEHHI